MENQSTYQIDRCATLQQLDSLEMEWADLISCIPDAPIFLSWEWIRTWWLYFGKGRELWLLTARDHDARLVGIAPLMIDHHLGWAAPRMITFIGTSVTVPVHLNILTHPCDRGGVLKAFLNYLLQNTNRWDVISLSRVAQDSGLYELFAAKGGRVRLASKKVSAYIPLPADWDTYSKTLTKKLRRNLKYFRSKLENDYPASVHFAFAADPQELPAAMSRLEELNKNRWHARERTSNFDYPNFSAFHQAIACLALQKGWLRLNQLHAGDHVIAQCYNFFFHNRIYAYAIAFDGDWSGYSPGRLAIANSVQAAIEEGATEYDWLGGEEEYKMAWTDKTRVEPEILFSKKILGRLWIDWVSAREALKQALVANARQWVPQSARDKVNQLLSPRYKKSTESETKDSSQ